MNYYKMNYSIRQFTTALFLMTIVPFFLTSCNEEEAPAQSSKYEFEAVEDDPLGTRIYTLDNGLKVYLSQNKKEPRIQTQIAVRAGSKNDPAETTGLAHYLEHMMFKGTNNVGTVDWEKEKVLLDQIEALYETHRKESDPEKKKAIYKQIDSVSYLASGYAIPNEYDKMVSSLGAKGTNAYTWVEQTVYVNDIPANEVNKWLKLESERFGDCVLRLFHTELETVYEEYNRTQDADGRQSYAALFESLFPKHQYGTQTTIGEGEHLKNPSMTNIYNYFETYYVPNNVAICLAGDLDYDATIAMVDEHFGKWQPGEVPAFTYEDQPAITEPIVREVTGVQPEHLYMGFRFDGTATKDPMMIQLIDFMLSNGQAGLIDLELNQKQKVLTASSFQTLMKDYTVHMLYGRPKAGQSLEEVQDLMLGQIERIKTGDFPDWLIGAVVKNLKLEEIQGQESNRGRASKFVTSFITEKPWAEVVNYYDEMGKITKEDVVKFAKEHYSNNYAVVYKRKTEESGRAKVDKPEITAIQINRDSQSVFLSNFQEMKSERLEPLWVDYKEEISTEDLGKGIELSYVENKVNEIFSLNYIIDMGSDHNKQLGLAVSYLPYLGTSKYTAEELQEEFYKLGLTFDVNTGRDQIYITLKGLEESLEEGLKLFEHVLGNAEPNPEAYEQMVQRMLKSRADSKLNKDVILRQGLMSYAKYGKENPFRDILPEDVLTTTDPVELVAILKDLTGFKHRIFYYGKEPQAEVKTLLAEYHKTPEALQDYPEPKAFAELPTTENKVLFVNYDMVQTEMMMVSKDDPFSLELMPYASLYNEFFGAGLSSIVFQEIREAKALAYSAYSYYAVPAKKEDAHYVYAYIGTQADKLDQAATAMKDLMNNMPEATAQYEAACDAALKKIESDRIVGQSVFWSYQRAKKRGLDYDFRKTMYEQIPGMDMEAMKAFFNEHIKGRNYTFIVIGKRENMDMEALAKLGPVSELTLEEVFNY